MTKNKLIGISVVTLLIGLVILFSYPRTAPKMPSSEIDFINGEYFPDSHTTRMQVQFDAPNSIKFVELLRTGRSCSDQKEQGLAYLKVHYKSGQIQEVELTPTGLFRVDNQPFFIEDKAIWNQIVGLLDAAKPAPQKSASK